MTKSRQTSEVLTTKTCKQMTDLVLGYLTGAIDARTRREFEQHLSICPDCVSFLNTYEKTVAVTQSVDSTEIPDSVRENILGFLRRRVRRVGIFLFYTFAQLTT
jgi:hypothetical protein